jgi:hypothetical protein
MGSITGRNNCIRQGADDINGALRLRECNPGCM